MNYEAILFDAAETLFTTRGTVGEIYGEVARKYGSTASPQEIQSAFLRNFRQSGPLTTDNEKAWWKAVVSRVFNDVGMNTGMEDQFNPFFEEVFAEFADSRGWKLFPETLSVLTELRNRKYKLGVISNFDSRIYSVMRCLKILDFFDTITVSSEAGYAKPHPGIFRAAIKAAGVPATRILFVGDSLENDIQGGAATGLQAILIDRNGSYPGTESIQNLNQILTRNL